MSGEIARDHEPTPDERDLVKAHLERRRRSPAAPAMRVTDKRGSSEISVDHPDPALGQTLLMEAIATVDVHFYDGLMTQLANAGSQGRQVDRRGFNFMLSVVKGIEPKDQVEAMLAAQMAAVHTATMTFARRLAHVENLPQQDSAERAFNKLARTFASQMEALKRYRSGGQQTVRVERVTVNEGGQAIVGNVEQPDRSMRPADRAKADEIAQRYEAARTGGGSSPKSEGQPHAKSITDASQSAMPSDIEAQREAVPVAGDKG